MFIESISATLDREFNISQKNQVIEYISNIYGLNIHKLEVPEIDLDVVIYKQFIREEKENKNVVTTSN